MFLEMGNGISTTTPSLFRGLGLSDTDGNIDDNKWGAFAEALSTKGGDDVSVVRTNKGILNFAPAQGDEIDLNKINAWLAAPKPEQGKPAVATPTLELQDLQKLFGAMDAGTVNASDMPKLKELRNSTITAFADSIQQALSKSDDEKLQKLLARAKDLGILRDVVTDVLPRLTQTQKTTLQNTINAQNLQKPEETTKAVNEEKAAKEKLQDDLKNNKSPQEIIKDLVDEDHTKDTTSPFSKEAGRAALNALIRDGADGALAKRLDPNDTNREALKSLISFLNMQAGADGRISTTDDLSDKLKASYDQAVAGGKDGDTTTNDDFNGDQLIGLQNIYAAILKAADKDHNGDISQEEFDAAKSMHFNKDGKTTRQKLDNLFDFDPQKGLKYLPEKTVASLQSFANGKITLAAS